MNITIYGSGYVGLVTGACLAQVGNHVLCVDIDEAKINLLKSGQSPIFEPGLDQIITANVAKNRLHFTTSATEGVAHGLFQFIAVGTPPDEHGSADLRYVLAVANSIGTHLDQFRVVVNKSTVPVGTAEKVRHEIQSTLQTRGVDIPFVVASNPEFLKEGAAIEDFMKPDRIIVGCDDPETAQLMQQLYAPFNRNHDRLITMDTRSAELTKYAANAMLATKISFMNELANLAEHLSADIERVRIGIGSDPRIGYHFIYPGCGYGGSCFPKDVQALEQMARSVDFPVPILNAVEWVNNKQKQRLFDKLNAHFAGQLTGKRIALWGLAFKPNTDDMREASSRPFMEQMWNVGATIQAYDPVAMTECRRIYGERGDLVLCENAETTLEGADALVIVTEWNEFRSPDFDLIKAKLRQPVIVDGRNLYNPEWMANQGFAYYAIGRGRTTVDRCTPHA